MYHLKKYIDLNSTVIRTGPNLIDGYTFSSLERKLLKTFIKTKIRLSYIFDFRKCKRLSENENKEIEKIINYFSLKVPSAVIMVGGIEYSEKTLASLKKVKNKGSKVFFTKTLSEISDVIKGIENLKSTAELVNRLITEESRDDSKKEPDITTAEESLKDFYPKKKIDLKFNQDTREEHIKEVTIYQCNDVNKLLLTSQTKPSTSKDSKRDIILSTMTRNRVGDLIRVEYDGKIHKIFKNVKIRNTIINDALLIEYREPKREVNLRNSYRYKIKSAYRVESIITFSGKKYFSNMHFDIDDISVTGAGLKVSKNKNGGFKASIGDSAKLEATLIEPGKMNSQSKTTKIESFVEVVRRSPLDKKEDLVGLKFCDLQKNYEMQINRFISNAQSYELRKKHRTV